MTIDRYRDLIADWTAERLMMLRRGNPDMGGPSMQDRRWAVDVTEQVLTTRIPWECPDCNGTGWPTDAAFPGRCTHPNAATIGDRLELLEHLEGNIIPDLKEELGMANARIAEMEDEGR